MKRRSNVLLGFFVIFVVFMFLAGSAGAGKKADKDKIVIGQAISLSQAR